MQIFPVFTVCVFCGSIYCYLYATPKTITNNIVVYIETFLFLQGVRRTGCFEHRSAFLQQFKWRAASQHYNLQYYICFFNIPLDNLDQQSHCTYSTSYSALIVKEPLHLFIPFFEHGYLT